MANHDDIAIGREFAETMLDFAHRDIHGAGDDAVYHFLRLAYVQQERSGAVIEAPLELIGRYRLH